MKSPYFSEEHEMLRDQVRRLVKAEIMPHGDQWERDGMTPRSLLRKMGALGLLGLRFPPAYGGAGMDVLGWVVLAEELGRSTYGGVTVTVMVHTAMASPHLVNAGSDEQLRRYAPGIIAGDLLCAIAVTEPDAGSDVGGRHRVRGGADRPRGEGLARHQHVHRRKGHPGIPGGATP
jgi:acyl-CoA dehydrogenase